MPHNQHRQPQRGGGQGHHSFTATPHAPPGRIFIVRHAERVDHKDRAWARAAGSDRVHDCAITEEGHAQARLMGAHILARALEQPPAGDGRNHGGDQAAAAGDAHFVVLSSPLVRCVETSQRIAEVLGVSKIHVEATLIEAAWYMAQVLQADASLVPSGRGGAAVARGNQQMIIPKHGVRLPVADLRRAAPGAAELVEHAPLAPVELLACPKRAKIVQPCGAEGCCERYAKQGFAALLARLGEFGGRQRTVVLVGHGDSIHKWFNEVSRTDARFPHPFHFNCFSELRARHDDGDGGAGAASDAGGAAAAPGGGKGAPSFTAVRYEPVGEYFGTSHLAAPNKERLGALLMEQRAAAAAGTGGSSNSPVRTVDKPDSKPPPPPPATKTVAKKAHKRVYKSSSDEDSYED
jgi:broad specificity phosphatase PhoE